MTLRSGFSQRRDLRERRHIPPHRDERDRDRNERNHQVLQGSAPQREALQVADHPLGFLELLIEIKKCRLHDVTTRFVIVSTVRSPRRVIR